GATPIANHQFFTRLGQKIITNMTVMTQAGKLYELDMRLRPSGNSGPLVTSLTAFQEYQREKAWTWEHQALTRARVVVGDSEITRALNAEVREALSRPRDRDALAREVLEMRTRMFKEKAPPQGTFDIKQSRGGIIDVEFLAQFLMLANAHHHPQILHSAIPKTLMALRQAGLLDSESYKTLDQAYALLRLVENRLRLMHDRSENRIGPDPVLRHRLAKLCHLPEGEQIVEVLSRHAKAVYGIYRRELAVVDHTDA
ncbi:MAG: hypothetical protein HQL53_07370, partial [Magnetococcales bacterium]|nr:hypothetical protein [Magnetococcales bacterium]